MSDRRAVSAGGGRSGEAGADDGDPRIFDRDALLARVEDWAHPSKLGSLLSLENMSNWKKWAAHTPMSLEECTTEQLPPLTMPPKYVQGHSSSDALVSKKRSAPTELIIYNNGDTRLTKKDRERQSSQNKRLAMDDIKLDSIIAMLAPEDPLDIDGFRTPIYLGKVLEVTPSTCGEYAISVVVQCVVPLTSKKGTFTDDMKKGWYGVCNNGHRYTGVCDRIGQCKEAAARALAAHDIQGHGGKYVYRAQAIEIIECDIALNGSTGTLTAASKKRLASRAPRKGGWNALFGV